MSTHIVKHGETYSLAGTLSATTTLMALSGAPGGLIEVNGYAKNKGTIELVGASAKYKHGGSLTDTGTLRNSGVITVGGANNSNHAALLQIDGVLINNANLIAAAGTDGAGGAVLIGETGRLRNQGTLTLKGGGAAGALGATLIADGVLANVASGTLELRGAAGNTAGVGTGASLVVAGTLTNSGLIGLYGSPGSIATPSSTSAPTLSIFGVATNVGTIAVGKLITGYADPAYNISNGALLAIDGVLTNAGSLSVAASSFYSYAATLTVAGTLVNQGEIFLQSGGFSGFIGYANASAGGLLKVFGAFDNDGTLSLAGYEGGATGAETVVDGTLTNAGTIVLQQDSRMIANGTMTNDGTIMCDGSRSFGIYGVRYYGNGGVITLNGDLYNNGVLTLQGGLSKSFFVPPFYYLAGGGGSVSVTGHLSNAGTIVVGGGQGAYYHNGSYGLGATLSITGIYGAVEVDYRGLIDIRQGYSLAGGAGRGGVLVDAGRLRVDGTIEIGGGIGSASGTLEVTATGFLTNASQIDGAGVLINDGFIEGSFGSSFGPGLTFINNGTLQNIGFGAALMVDSTISTDPGRSGTIDFFSAGTIALNGGVGVGQVVEFTYAPDTLQLGDLSGFSGTLSGLAATDVIDFLGQNVVSASATGTTLAIGLAGGATYDLALAAPLYGLSLRLQSDKHGGTDLNFSTKG